jgi:hypothetical protein
VPLQFSVEAGMPALTQVSNALISLSVALGLGGCGIGFTRSRMRATDFSPTDIDGSVGLVASRSALVTIDIGAPNFVGFEWHC